MASDSGGGESKSQTGNRIRNLFVELAESFYFGDPKDPSFFDNEALKPKLFVNVLVKTKENDAPVNVMYEAIVLKNILGDMLIDGTRNTNGSLRFVVRSAKDLNKLLNTKELKLNDVVYTIDAISDKKLNNGRGIFYCKDINDIDEKDILRWTKKYGVVEIYPFTKKEDKQKNPDGSDKFVRTGLYKATFNTNVVPHKLPVFSLMVPVKLYFDKPMYCYRCGLFGHTKKTCKYCENGDKCRRCGGDDHKTDECKNEMRCINCAEEHDLKPMACPIYNFEKEIIRYSTISQLPQGRVRRQAIDTINNYISERATQSSYSEILMREVDTEPVNEPWYRPLEQRQKTRENPKKDDNNKNDQTTKFTNYFMAYSQSLPKRPRISEKSQLSITPRDRVEKIDAVKPRATISYSDLVNPTPEKMKTDKRQNSKPPRDATTPPNISSKKMKTDSVTQLLSDPVRGQILKSLYD